MKYLTADELKRTERETAHDMLEDCSGKSVRDDFSIEIFNTYHDRSFSDRANTSILDIGVASGFFDGQLVASGYRNITACDLDDYLRPEYRTMVKDFKVFDLSWERFPWPDETFDMAVAWCVLPHVENPFFAIREIARVLKPGGVFIFTAPYLGSRPSVEYFIRHKDFRSYRPTNNHLVLFTPGVVAKAVLKYFTLAEIEYHARLHKIFRGWRGYIRRVLYGAASRRAPWRKALERRWAYNAAYVLQKPVA